jgi:hypothetical protein
MNFLVIGLASIGIFACNQGPRAKKLKVGEKSTVMPSKRFELASPVTKYENIFFHFNMGGKALEYKDKTTVEIYYQNNKDVPRFSFNAQQLKNIHKDTNCPKKYESLLSNAYEGDAIFCNSKIELDKVDSFKAVRQGKSNKSATSYSLEGVIEGYDLIKVGVGFH